MHKPVKVRALSEYRVHVEFEDGTSGEVNLSHLAGKGVFKLWDDYANFEKVFINEDSGAIAWNDEIDICSDNLYYKIKGIDSNNLYDRQIA